MAPRGRRLRQLRREGPPVRRLEPRSRIEAQVPARGVFDVGWLIQTIVNLSVPVLYFLPTYIAWKKKDEPTMDWKLVAKVDIFLGWTVVMWFVAMWMALLGVPSRGGGEPQRGGGGGPPPPPAPPGSPMTTQRACTSCGGTGHATCPACGGQRGQWQTPSTAQGSPQWAACGACIGSGRVQCLTCGGSGRVW
jgi:hypothetical protein